MPRRRACGFALVLSACGGGMADAGQEFPECALAPGEPIHAATFTAEVTHVYAPDQLVADADYVYFADGEAIHRVPRCGGPAELLIAGARPFNDGLAIADGVLYWIAGDDGVVGPQILKMSVDGGEPVVIAEFEGYSHHIRVAGETVVWNTAISGFPDESQLRAVHIDGSDPRVLARSRYGWSFDLDDDVVYAAGYLPDTDPADSDRLLFALPVDGGPLTVLVKNFGDDYPSGVEVGGDEIFYFRSWSTDNLAIERVLKSGGTPEIVDLGGAAVPDQLLFAGGQLYGVETSGSVVRIVDGETPTPLIVAEALAVPGRVFADAGGLFIGDSATECIEWSMDPSGEPPGEFCVRETIDIRVLSLGR